MNYRITPGAEAQITAQIDYLISQGAIVSAGQLRDRIFQFIGEVLTAYPRFAPPISEITDVRETIIPKTKIILHYRIVNDELIDILAVYHSSQDRPKTPIV